MAKRRSTSGDLVKLWILGVIVVGCCAWTLSNSTVDCNIGPGIAGGGTCIATSMAHGLAPYLPWVIVVTVAFVLLVTLRVALRRR